MGTENNFTENNSTENNSTENNSTEENNFDWGEFKKQINSASNEASDNLENTDESWGNIGKTVADFITTLMDYKNHLVFLSVVILIIFILSIRSGGYYFIYKMIQSKIDQLILSKNKGIIFFILKVFIFYYLFKIILSTTFDLIFVNVDEDYGCKMKEKVDHVTNILGTIFFSIYLFFQAPLYLFDNISSIYNRIIDCIIPLLKNSSDKQSLKESKNDLDKLKNLMELDIYKFYEILTPLSNGFISKIIRTIFIKITSSENTETKKNTTNNQNIEASDTTGISSLCECLKRKKQLKDKDFKVIKNKKALEDNSNVVSITYAGSIITYFIFLGFAYLGLFSLFPDSDIIRLVIFILLTFIVIRMMIGKLAFKAATHNIAIINAFFKEIQSKAHDKISKKEKDGISDLISHLNPILKYIFGKKVRESPGFKKLFTIEDLLECIQKECNPDTSEN